MEEDNVLMSRRQGMNLEGGGYEKKPKHIEEAIAGLELVTRGAREYTGEEERVSLLAAYAGKGSR